MTGFGYALSSEEHGPRCLVSNAARAESLGFEFVSISDHFHPWISDQGHSPFVWSVLGAISTCTDALRVCVGVTCPTVRIHPAVLAQASATTSLLLGDRFVFGVGSGEALNEHILGHRWPPPETRLAMLEEAVAVMRALWTGETIDLRGDFFTVENARLFDPPDEPIPVIVSGFGPAAAALAGRIGDGYFGHSPDEEALVAYEEAGGTGPKYALLRLCWAESEDDGRKAVHRGWPNGAIPGQLSQDLPTWTHFEQAAELVTEDDAVASIPCGPDITGDLVETVRAFRDAGYSHLAFHQVGADQAGFFGYWEHELRPALAEFETAD